MIRFSKYKILEGFDVNIETNQIVLNLNNQDFVDTRLGYSKGEKKFILRQSFFKEFNSYCYSVYQMNNNKPEGEITSKDIQVALKMQSDKNISDEDISTILNRAAILLNYRLKDENIDMLITIDSSSELSNIFLNKIVEKLSYSPKIYKKAIFKNPNLDEITIEADGILSPKSIADLQKNIDKNKKNPPFKIHNIQNKDRKFVKNWLKINQDVANKIKGKTICLVDDYFTNGTTINESFRLISEFGPKKMMALTILKGK